MSEPAEKAAELLPSDALRIVRDTLANEAQRIRLDQARLNPKGIESGRLAVVRSLNAAVDVVTAVIAHGQNMTLSATQAPKWVQTERDQEKWRGVLRENIEWAASLGRQARAALMADWPAAEPSDGGAENELAAE